MNELSTFVYVLRLVKPQSFGRMSLQDEATIDTHFEYLKKALTQGKLTLAGRCVGGEFGIVIFQAESEEQAKEFVKNDPAVKAGVMTAELHTFRIALIEKG